MSSASSASTASSESLGLSQGDDVRQAFLRVQNGSDVRGVAADLNPEEPVTFTPEMAFEIAAGFTRWIAEQTEKEPGRMKISVGRDSRITGPILLRAAALGIQSTGATAVDCGLASTPAMFMSTISEGYNYDGSIIITASHLPPNRNGMKFFTKAGGTAKTDVKQILMSAAESVQKEGPRLKTYSSPREPETVDFMQEYARQLRDKIKTGCNHPDTYDTPLKGFHVLVDAGNGAGGFFATNVLVPLGADVSGSQFLEPDGMFPNHVPNPEDKKAMAMTIEAVKTQASVDLGVIFDTDVDRSAVVDASGRGINRNLLIALMSSIVLREHPGTTILTDSVTSNGLTDFINQLGGKHFRYRRGYKNVIDKGVALNIEGEPCWLAIETSGHGAMRENFMLDDGAYLVVKILIEMVRLRLAGEDRGIAALLERLKEPQDEGEFRLKADTTTKDDHAQGDDFAQKADQVLEDFKSFVDSEQVPGWSLEPVSHEGYRVTVDEGDGRRGWVLLRKSLHDPVLPLNVESELPGGVRIIVQTLVDQFFKNETETLDISALTKYLNS